MPNLATRKLFEGTPNVFLATPSTDGKVCQAYTFSLVSSLNKLREAGIGVTYSLLGGNCHVDDARNGLVREFMTTSCTDLIFLDADVGWCDDDLVSLAKFNKDMVAGVYPKKTDDAEFPVHVLPGTTLRMDEEGLVEVHALPTGFLKISRHALEILLEKNKHRQFRGQDYKEGDRLYTILFERTYEDGHRWSGDYAFCRKWAAEGGKLYVAPEFQFVHEGPKEWGGCLGDHWRKVHGVTELKFSAALKAVRDGRHTANHLVDLVAGWSNEKWSGQPELLEICIQLGRQATGPILECGSGLTTLILNLVSQHPVISLENSPVWASYTAGMAAKFGIQSDIRCAPLVSVSETADWYLTDELPNFSLVVCDGPNRMTHGGRTGIKSIAAFVATATFVLDDPDDSIVSAIQEICDVEFHMLGEEKPVAISKVRSVHVEDQALCGT